MGRLSACPPQTDDDDQVQLGRGCQVEEMVAAVLAPGIQLDQSARQLRVRGGVIVIASAIEQVLGEACPGRVISTADPARFPARLVEMFTKPGIRSRVTEIAPRHPEHGEGWREAIFNVQRVERGDQLALGQIAAGSEDHDSCRWRHHLKIRGI